jgi:hypothetical protein
MHSVYMLLLHCVSSIDSISAAWDVLACRCVLLEVSYPESVSQNRSR